MQPLVTVLTPCFNRMGFIAETIESVLSQDYPNIEHLALDDGSTDGTPSLLAQYGRRYPGRFHSVRHENMGQARTLNRGFGLAHGELLIVLNSDDTLLDHAVSHLADALAAQSGAVAAFPDFRVVDEEGAEVVEIFTKSYSFAEMVRTQNNFLGPGVMFKKTLAVQVGGWNERYRVAPDFDFWLRGGLVGDYVHVPEVLATWRKHPGSITVAHGGVEATTERLRLVEEFFARPDLPPEVRSLEPEAYRSVYFISAITALPEMNRLEDRFVVHDRLAWSQDSRAQGSTIESELLAERERGNRLDEALKNYVSHCAYLQSELEARDRADEERDEQVEHLRSRLAEHAHSGCEPEKRNTSQERVSAWWDKVIGSLHRRRIPRRLAELWRNFARRGS